MSYINLDDVPQQSYIPLDTQENLPVQNPEVINTRASKAAYGLNGIIPFAQIKNRIQQGDEDGVRQEASLKVDQGNIAEARQMLLGNPTPEAIAAKFEKQNPATVFEDKYAHEFMNAFYSDPEAGTFADVSKIDSEGTGAVLGVSKELLSWRELIHKRLVDATEKQDQQSFISKTWDFGKDVAGVTSMYTLRGNVPGTFFSGGLTGANLEAQRQKLLTLPYKERAIEFNRIMDQLSEANPGAAIQFADFMESPSSLKIASDNAFNALDISVVGQTAGAIGKGLFGIATKRAIRRMTDTATSAAPIADGSSAPIASVASSAAGLPLRSAKFRMADELTSQLKGAEDPTQRMRDGILSILKPSATLATETPDGLGVEALNRLRQSFTITANKIANLAQNTSRVLRIGDVLNSQEVVEKAAEEITNRYPGLSGNTLNIMPVRHDPISNTFSADQILGRNNGSFFSALKEAETFAEFNGLNGSIHSLDLKPSPAHVVTNLSKLAAQRIAEGNMGYKAARDVARVSDVGKVPPDHTRFFHGGPPSGGQPPTTGGGRWSTTDYKYARDFRSSEGKPGQVWYVDIPKGNPTEVAARAWDAIDEKAGTNAVGTYHHIEIPEAWAKLMKPYASSEELTGLTAAWASKRIEQQGRGYYIAINRPINETAPFIRSSIMQTAKSLNSNKGWANRLGVGWIRTPSEILNEQDMTNRQLAVHAPSLWKQAIADVLAPTGKAFKQNSLFNRLFGKDSKFEIMLKDLQAEQKDFESVGELNDYYQRKWNERPSEAEINGYFALIQGNKVDYIMRNLAVYKNNARLGGELHTVTIGDPYKTLIAPKSIDFNGIVYNHVPESDFRVLVQNGTKLSTPRLSNLKNSKTGQGQLAGIASGEWKLIRIIAPEHKPFAEHTDTFVNWVLTKEAKSRPLEFKQIPERPGGHMEYPYDNYVKQGLFDVDRGTGASPKLIALNKKNLADIEHTLSDPLDSARHARGSTGMFEHLEKEAASIRDWLSKNEPKNTIYHYLSDTTAMAVDSRAMGGKVVDTLHEVQRLIKAGDMAGAEKASLNIPVPWEKLRDLFTGVKDSAGKMKVPPKFSLDQPFYTVPRGKTIADLKNHFESYNVKDVSRFSDISKPGGSLNKQFQVEFTGQRDAYDVMAIHDEGTTWKPHFAYRPADLVDPYTSINRSMSRIIDSTYMDDVKISSVESWLQRAKGLLDAPERDILANPYATFYNTPLKKGIDDLQRQQLEAERYQIKAFAGIPSKLDTYLNELSFKMADSIHGSAGLKRGALIGSKWVYDNSRSVPSFLRAATYHSSLGLFALPQFLVQLNTFVTIAGISGYGKAGQGTAAALMNVYSHAFGASPEALKKLGKIAETFGFRPGEWEELRTALYNTGFNAVGPETNQLMAHSHIYPNKIFTSAAGKVLDAGQIFFVGGEKMSKFGAWFTAGKEFRDLHPTGRLTTADVNKILNRAVDLAGNMDKSSKSLLQSGFGAFPTQFLGYQLRLFEQFTGKRLDWKQKLRLFATYSAVYGAPVASGIGALPLTDAIRSYALNHGYVEGEDKISDTIMNGVPAMLLKAATGEFFNVGERYGAPGFDVVNDVLAGDKNFWSLFAGATGNTLTAYWKAKDPFIATFGSWINGENTFKLTSDDLVQPLKTTAIGNSASRYYEVLNSMNWISRNETKMASGVSPAMATLMTITGLQPLEADKLKLYKQLDNSYKSYYEQAENGYLVEFNRAIRDLNGTVPNYSSASTHFNNAESFLIRFGYPEQRRNELVARAWATTKESRPALERWNYWVQGRNTPAGQEGMRQGTFGRIEQQQGNIK